MRDRPESHDGISMPQPGEEQLFGDISELIDGARTRVATTVNSELVMLYWTIGQRVRDDVLRLEKPEYGKGVVMRLSERLIERHGRGFSWRNLFSMVRFANLYSDSQILQTLSAKLAWSHFVQLIAIDDALERRFYEALAAREHWSVRMLQRQVARRLYQRTAADRDPAELKAELNAVRDESPISPGLAFRDPYVLDFLELPRKHSEADLEAAILDEMRNFLLELGAGFAFVDRQKRIKVDGDDYYLDLLFYHYRMRCFVAVELKTRKLKPGDKGQMELYLRWLDRYERGPGDEAPVGLILCAKKGPQQTALLGLDHGEIRAAEYITEPMRNELQRRLEAADRRAATGRRAR